MEVKVVLEIPITAYKPSPNLTFSHWIPYSRMSITNVSSREEPRHFLTYHYTSLTMCNCGIHQITFIIYSVLLYFPSLASCFIFQHNIDHGYSPIVNSFPVQLVIIINFITIITSLSTFLTETLGKFQFMLAINKSTSQPI